MEKHEILASNIDWPNLVRHVARDRVVVELAEGQVPVARLVPIERPKTFADLDRALRSLPRLGDDAEQFKADVNQVRSSLKELDDPWEYSRRKERRSVLTTIGLRQRLWRMTTTC
ncbi:MAG: hypothetical protein SGI77_01745 [Pirellulaceae bacterium]|nr:hypothetical protein [Pirellulaceae bacterium]